MTNRRHLACWPLLAASWISVWGCHPQERPFDVMGGGGGAPAPFVELPAGFRLEKVASGLTFPTGMTWDGEGRLYVSESGGGMAPSMIATPRIVRIDPDGSIEPILDLAALGVHSPVNDVTWHDGYFYLSHRMPDLTGAVSRVKPGGALETIISGLPSYFEHQTNEIVFGPDGKLYIAQGPPTNSGVVGPDVAPWVKDTPQGAAIPARDLVLTGENYQSDNFLTSEQGDTVLTGAFVPFGTETRPGQVIKGGGIRSGGTIIRANPDGSAAEVYAWGFRNIFGLGFGPDGELYATQNGMDLRGLRPAKHDKDALYRVREGAWYGWPDFTGTLEPITADKVEAQFLPPGTQRIAFVIDHAASGLEPPDKRLLVASFEHHGSTDKFDFAPRAWGTCGGRLFAAQWGDLAPPTSPLHPREHLGYKVVVVDRETGEVHDFARNRETGPASAHNRYGEGLERPIEVRFANGQMYVLDFGRVEIDEEQAPPYVYLPQTGMLWRISREEGTLADCGLEERAHQE